MKNKQDWIERFSLRHKWAGMTIKVFQGLSGNGVNKKLYYLTLMATKNIYRLLNTSFEYKCLHPHKVRDVRVVKAMNCCVSESNHWVS